MHNFPVSDRGRSELDAANHSSTMCSCVSVVTYVSITSPSCALYSAFRFYLRIGNDALLLRKQSRI